ncbi:MAG: polyamine aminopropyltransferase [Spirochaetota bacterium]
MELWFSEKLNDRSRISIRIEQQVFHKKSKYQTIDIFETVGYGRLLVIDGFIMLTEEDEFVYHECLAHVPLQLLDQPERVLIIGGGDGGTAREVLKYPSIKQVVMVEIDGEVPEACRKYLPGLARSMDDPRLEMVFEDGASFVQQDQQPFDLIIIDSTDPIGPGKVLFSEPFYKNCRSILKEKGVLTAQTESPFDQMYRETLKGVYASLKRVYGKAYMYTATIPTYPYGLWSFAFASGSADPVNDPFRAFEVPEGLRYYNRELARSMFTLPNFVREITGE